MVENNISLDQISTTPPASAGHSGCGSCGSGSAADGLARCGNGLEKIYPTTAVRLGFMRYVGEFTHPPEMRFSCGAKVVIQSRRGIEIGEQVSLTCNGCDKSVTRDQIKAWVNRCGDDTFIFDAGRILREATAADLAEYARIQTGARAKRDHARSIATEHSLPLKVVECECLFGGERIIFFFTAAERVDFRDMVKDLAKEYRTRIEMRQIGARDEARILADYETCGREVCCKVFLKTLRPISMRMAKLQKATLDPSQVSGRCGRLKCCLRYEHVGYEELDKLLPRVGARIHTNHGSGVVVNRQILTQLVQIRTDDDTLMTVVAEDIVPEGQKAAPGAPAVADDVAGHAETDGAHRANRNREGRTASSQPPPPTDQENGDDRPRGDEGGAPQPRSDADTQPQRRRRRKRRRRKRGGHDGENGGGTPGASPDRSG